MQLTNTGKVIEVKDGIVLASGLSQVGYNELVKIRTSAGVVSGIALNLEESQIGIIVLGDYQKVREGDYVEAVQEVLSIKVDDNILGKAVNALGYSLEANSHMFSPSGKPMFVERLAPSVIARKNITRPLLTGTIGVDAAIPIGKGQRQLVIGDRHTGKTAFCIDTILSQKSKDVICVYVSIGQKASKLSQIMSKLEDYGAMEYTVIVAANASDPASMQYIAPYAGCAIGEYFCELGKDALVIYDDLSKHAWAYRQISLLLRRPPGREAYPGDIFYLHSKLLERSLQYSELNRGGSLTALPVVETLAGDVSAYIPTNVISITDGQIYLDTELFNSGQHPAVNFGTSVSRVGSEAQLKCMKQVAGKLKMDLAQYRELQAFAQFGSELDEATTNKLNRGSKLIEILKQAQYAPYKVEEEVLLLFAGVNGFYDDVPLDKLKSFVSRILMDATKSLKLLASDAYKNTKITEAEIVEINKELKAIKNKVFS